MIYLADLNLSEIQNLITDCRVMPNKLASLSSLCTIQTGKSTLTLFVCISGLSEFSTGARSDPPVAKRSRPGASRGVRGNWRRPADAPTGARTSCQRHDAGAGRDAGAPRDSDKSLAHY